ncbi:hypothetical protein AAVH_40462, partial [Aphelenchoides avenae]
AFAKAIRQACDDSLTDVFKLGVTVNSDALEYPMGLSFDTPHKNDADACLSLFKLTRIWKVQQSNKEINLFEPVIKVSVTVIGKMAGGHKRDLHFGVNEGCLIMIRNPGDRHCLFHALAAARLYTTIGDAGGPSKMLFSLMTKRGPNYRRGGRNAQQVQFVLSEYTQQLMQALHVPPDQDSYSVEEWVPKAQKYFADAYPDKRYRITVFGKYGDLAPLYKAPVEAPLNEICIFYDGTHFHGIRNIASFFNRSYYCIDCERTFANKKEHTSSCVRRCTKCARMGVGFPCTVQQNYVRFCPLCNKTFYRHSCYEEHIRNKICEKYKVCLDCGVCYDTKNIRRFSASGEHVCNTRLCLRCKCYHPKDSECYIAPLEQEEEKDTRFIAFDCESECVPIAENDPVAEHKVNMISAKVFCNRCLRDGNWKDNAWASCEICGNRGRIFNFNGAYRENPLKDFVDWLKSLDKKYDSYTFSHFGGRYDIILLSGEYLRQGGYQLSFIRTGMKIFQMVVASKNGSPKTVFRDSFNLFPFALADLVSAFSLEVRDKGVFPFHYNRAENYLVELPNLPAKHYYGYNSMKPSKQAAFNVWYEQN